jgi:hypothetical protein
MFPVEQGAEFPFNCNFQRYMFEQITSFVTSSPWFSGKYGDDWNLIFNISARWSMDEDDTERGVKLSEQAQAKLDRYRSFTSEPLRVEVRGPTVFKKTKDVEYSIFLPFRRVIESETPPVTALNYIFAGVYSVLERMQIDTSKLRAEQDRIIRHICSEPKMFYVNPHPESGIGRPVSTVVSKS